MRGTAVEERFGGVRLEPGQVFAGYEIERRLGAGGMGVVYLAQHPRLGRRIALKVLADTVAADERGRARFEREAAVAAMLDHANIVPVLDRSAPGEDTMWIAMRYVSGGDVAGLLAGGPLAPDRAVRLLIGAARGLDHAHRAGVLHRDVKPANILVDSDSSGLEQALVTDFGIARTLDDTVTMSGVIATLAYTAPERFLGQGVDQRADVYSLGCTLYEMLTGTAPFAGGEQAAMVGAHLTAPPPRPTAARPELPAGFDEVIALALAKEPDQRYPNCMALADAAARLSDSIPIPHTSSAAPQTIRYPEPAGPPPVRHAAGTPPLRWSTSDPLAPSWRDRGSAATPMDAPPDTAPPLAVTPQCRAVLRSPVTLNGHTKNVRTLAFRSDGEMLATSGPDCTVRCWQPRTGSPIGSPLTVSSRWITSIDFAGDSSIVAVADHDQDVTFWSLPDGNRVGKPMARFGSRIVWAPGGDLLAGGGNNASVKLADLRTEQQAGMHWSGRGATIAAVQFSPDGRLLATGDNSGIATLWDVASAQTAGPMLPGAQGPVTALAFHPGGDELAGCTGAAIVLWGIASRQVRHSFWPAPVPTRTLAFSPDGALLATGSDDGRIRLWDVASRQPAGPECQAHAGRIVTLAFDPSGTLLASSGEDRLTRLWPVARDG